MFFSSQAEAPREEEDRACAEISQRDRRLHLDREGRASQDPSRAHHPGGLPRRGHGNSGDVLRPLARQVSGFNSTSLSLVPASLKGMYWSSNGKNVMLFWSLLNPL